MQPAEFYNNVASIYDIRQQNPWTEMLRKKETEMIEKYAFGDILDAGCGTGFHIKYLEKSGNKNIRKITGIDISDEMVKIARKNVSASVTAGNIENLPFDDNTFDTVLCMFTVLNLCNAEKAVGEIRRVLAKKGILILSVASVWDNSGKPRKLVHVNKQSVVFRLFAKTGLEKILKESGLEILEFGSLFRGIMPKWADWTPLAKEQRKILGNENKLPAEKGAIYLAVARK